MNKKRHLFHLEPSWALIIYYFSTALHPHFDQTPKIFFHSKKKKKKKKLQQQQQQQKESNIPPKPKCYKPKKAQGLSFNLYNKMPNSPMIDAHN